MQINRSSKSNVVLFSLSLAIWASTFGNAQQRDGREFGNFDPALELLVSYGRPIALAIIIFCVLFNLAVGNKLQKFKLFQFGGILLIVQLIFNSKILLSGANSFALQATVTYLLIFLGLYIIPRSLSSGTKPHESILFYFAVLFATTNLYVSIFHTSASQTDFGRFFGVMQNPQHFAMTALLPIPAVAAAFLHPSSQIIKKTIALGSIAVLAYLVYLTGSRMGMLSLALIAAVYSYAYRRKLGTVIVVAVFLVAAAATTDWITSLQLDAVGRLFEGRTDTRTAVWLREFRDLAEHPLFGVPLNENNRLEFSENLWLSWASNGGLVVAALSLLLMTQCLKFIVRVNTQKWAAALVSYSGYSRLATVTALSTLLLLTIFESVFAGIFTSMAMLSLVIFSSVSTMNDSLKKQRRRPAQSNGHPSAFPARRQKDRHKPTRNPL